jgi:hypothetical protein
MQRFVQQKNETDVEGLYERHHEGTLGELIKREREI